MPSIIIPNKTDAAHLEAVKNEMLVVGAPTIRCIMDPAYGVLVALEGSHRLTAAHQLGFMPTLQILDCGSLIARSEIDLDDYGTFDGEFVSAGDAAELLAGAQGDYPGCPWLKFEEIDAITC